MLKWILAPAPVPARAEPTALLTLMAGEFAPAISRVWPEPHTPYLTASTARRHLVGLALALGRELGPLAERLLGARLRTAIRAVAPAPPAGLERALGRLGETAWTASAYRRLLALLCDPKAGKRLRHAEAIDHAAVARLGLLPGPLGRALHLTEALTDDGARAVAEAHGVIAFRLGPAAAEAAVARWATLATEAALFEAVRDDLYPDPPQPPHPGTARLKPLATKAAIRAAARRFENCLSLRMHQAISGWSAFYEWTDAPGAIVEISRDAIFGWRLEEAKGPRNALLGKDVRQELTSELALMGVYVGRSGWQLERALSPDVGRNWRLSTVEEDLAEVFGD